MLQPWKQHLLFPHPKHPVHHSVPTTPGPPVFAKARMLEDEKLESARKDAMEVAGVICHSNSPWASPLHMVQKPDGSLRPCGKYHRLNTMTILDRDLRTKVADLISCINGCIVFTKLDLSHQGLLSSFDGQRQHSKDSGN